MLVGFATFLDMSPEHTSRICGAGGRQVVPSIRLIPFFFLIKKGGIAAWLGLVGVGTGLVIKTHRGEYIVLKLHKYVKQVVRDPQRRGDLGAIGTCEDVLQLELI